mgnify:CR=1 FL=1
MSPDEILDALDPDQRAVAEVVHGPVVVLAGAGTGKTRAITHRIAYGVRAGYYPTTSVLAVTFTARAAGEMRGRLRALGVGGVQARTFHAAALRQVGYFWPKIVGGAPPRIVEQKAQIVAHAATGLGISVDRLAVRDISSEIEWAKVSLVPADGYAEAVAALRREPPAGLEAQTVARLLRAYEDTKNNRALMDFEDVLLYLADMIGSHTSVANEIRQQYRRFVVDEYQDVSPLQQLVLDQWMGPRRDLCVVGDPSQTIYSFTGATPRHLLEFRKRFPDATEVRLVRDYRSTPQVVGAANALLADPRARTYAGLELKAQRPAGPPVGRSVHDDDEAEAAFVAGRAARLIASGVRASEIAVLFRTNAQSAVLENAFADAGVPYLVRGGERFFQRKDVRDALVLLRGAARAVEPGVALGEAVRDVLLNAGWAPEPPTARGAVRERWEAMQALVALADDLATREGADIRMLVAELDERAAVQHAPTVEGVTLASLHAAKGLEWDAVFLVGLSEGLMPISLATDPAAIAEEKRLLYVGITRAREHLHLSWARSRGGSGRASRTRSRFLEHLGADATKGRRSTVVHDRSEGPDPVLLDSLRRWRDLRAEDIGRPVHVVVTDVTLEEIATLRPTTLAELADVRGLGADRLDRYADDLLRLLEQHRG